MLARLQAASIAYRMAYGPRLGQKLLTLRNRSAPSPVEKKRCAANARQPLERLSINPAGQVVLELKTAYRDGSTHLLFSPLEFLQRFVALVPRPRLNLVRFHGVLAPNAKWRAQIVPGGQAKTPHA